MDNLIYQKCTGYLKKNATIMLTPVIAPSKMALGIKVDLLYKMVIAVKCVYNKPVFSCEDAAQQVLMSSVCLCV